MTVRQSNRRSLFIPIAILMGIVAGLVVAEGALRLILGDTFMLGLGWYGSERLFHERASSDETRGGIHYTYDAQGFRGQAPHPQPERTVLFIGDSFTEGSGVSDDGTFSAVAERELWERGVRVQCLNAGVHGLCAAQELRLLREILADRHVAAVVVQLFPHNDLSDNWEDGGFSLENGRLVDHDPRQVPPRVTLREAIARSSIVHYSITARVFVRALVPAHYFEAPLDDAAFELERQLLIETLATGRQHGTPVLFVVVGADPSECASINDDAPDHRAYRKLRKMVRALDAPSLDLCSVASRPEDFGTVDPHYSPLGYSRVGHAVADALVPLLDHRDVPSGAGGTSPLMPSRQCSEPPRSGPPARAAQSRDAEFSSGSFGCRTSMQFCRSRMSRLTRCSRFWCCRCFLE